LCGKELTQELFQTTPISILKTAPPPQQTPLHTIPIFQKAQLRHENITPPPSKENHFHSLGVQEKAQILTSIANN
jgi:hypothetical protein